MTKNVNHSNKLSCGLETSPLRSESKTAANNKTNANFLFGGFIASYESLCVNDQLRRMRKLPQIKNFVYPLSVMRHYKNSFAITYFISFECDRLLTILMRHDKWNGFRFFGESTETKND